MDVRERLRPTNAGIARLRGDLWTWVYGPLLAGLALVAAGLMCAAGAGDGGVGVWADVSIIYLTMLAMVALLLGGVVLGLLIYGVGRLSGWLLPVIARGRETVDRAAGMVQRGADLSVRPILWLGGVGAVGRFARRRIASLWRRTREGQDDRE